jgi:hypothetical protein
VQLDDGLKKTIEYFENLLSVKALSTDPARTNA